jgi:hypothetical protein
MPEFLQPLKTVPVFILVPARNGDLTLGGESETLQKLFILGTRAFSKTAIAKNENSSDQVKVLPGQIKAVQL